MIILTLSGHSWMPPCCSIGISAATVAIAIICFHYFDRRLLAIRQQSQRTIEHRCVKARDRHDVLVQTLHATRLLSEKAIEDIEHLISFERTLEQLPEWLERAAREEAMALSYVQIDPICN